MKTATLRTRLAMLATPSTALEAVELRVIRSELAAREYRSRLAAKLNGAARVQRIKPSPSSAAQDRANALRREGRDIINLVVGEPDFDTPAHIRSAAC